VTRGGYDAFEDPYTYKRSDCLKNRLGLRDPDRLQAFELEMSTLRAQEPLPGGHFRPAHYRRIHWHLFRDVYRWAGRYRTVRTSKGGNPFCYPEHIPAQMNRLFADLRGPSFARGADGEAFIDSATRFLADLNAIHPFREGNGRTQLAFLYVLGLRAKHELHLDRIREARFLAAMIESFHGHLDALRAELSALRA
jgi:cell filamentation protein